MPLSVKILGMTETDPDTYPERFPRGNCQQNAR